jgi:RNA polymerase sigma-70 factor (ECF subfamily)
MRMISNYTDEEQLAREVKRGNERAFDHLFRTRYARMCRLATAFINDPSIAEDIVQEIFSSIWQHHHRVDDRKDINGYLFTSVRNACLNHLRDQRPNVAIDTLLQESFPCEPPPDVDEPRARLLWQAIESLPLQCKIIFKLVVVDETKYHDAATRLGISVNTVKSQIKIAYRTLREKLDKETLLLCTTFRRFPSPRDSES